MNRRAALHLIVCTALMISVLTGCSSAPKIEIVDEGRTFASGDVVAVIRSTEPGTLAQEPSEEAEKLRTKALSSLRQRGDDGAQIANLITDSFPSTVRGVPYYIERAQVDGADAWIIIEATGRPGATLKDKRLWVLDNDGEVVFSATR